MKRIVSILFLVLILGYTGHGQSYYVKNESNPRDGSSAVYMVNNFLTPQLELSAGIIRSPNGSNEYLLTSHYSGYDRFSAHSLRLSVDGEILDVKEIVNIRRRPNSEIVAFRISEDQFLKIGTAHRISIYLKGNWSIELDMEQKNVQRFRDFYHTHMR
jgi:hypothetical protein